jgi:hypothetical protein
LPPRPRDQDLAIFPDERANIGVIIANENAPLALPFRSQSERLFGNRFPKGFSGIGSTDRSSSARGSQSSTVVPSPRRLDIRTVPSDCAANPCTIERPSPEPRPTSLVVKKARKLGPMLLRSGEARSGYGSDPHSSNRRIARMNVRKNARLTPQGRLLLVRRRRGAGRPQLGPQRCKHLPRTGSRSCRYRYDVNCNRKAGQPRHGNRFND